MEISTVAKTLEKLSPKRDTTIIAIDGFGGSGKTTVAAQLAEHLPASTVVEMDNFINKEHFYDDSWELAFDREAVKAHVLSLAGDRQYKYIIVEGISSTHPQLVNTYDFTIWVDTPIDIAKSRGALRDKGNENEYRWDAWAKNDMKYFKQYSPKDRADVVIVNR